MNWYFLGPFLFPFAALGIDGATLDTRYIVAIGVAFQKEVSSTTLTPFDLHDV